MKTGPRRIGLVVAGTDSSAILAGIDRAEELGIQAAWLPTGGAGLDALTLFAAAAVRTGGIVLGTSVVPTFPRHPVAMAQQVQVLAQLAPGRFRLGIGPGHAHIIEGIFGIQFREPLGHLGEYVHVLKGLLQEGSVDFEGRYYTAHARIPSPVEVPIMASALQPKSFELCGAEADGAISWVCPSPYLRQVAYPAMVAGAQRAKRPVPPLIAHVPVCVHDDPAEVRSAVREQFATPKLPFGQRMFAAAGFSEASNGEWSDAMIDATTLYGDEAKVAEKIKEIFALGATEVLASPVPAGGDRAGSLERTLQLLAQVARSMEQ